MKIIGSLIRVLALRGKIKPIKTFLFMSVSFSTWDVEQPQYERVQPSNPLVQAVNPPPSTQRHEKSPLL